MKQRIEWVKLPFHFLDGGLPRIRWWFPRSTHLRNDGWRDWKRHRKWGKKGLRFWIRFKSDLNPMHSQRLRARIYRHRQRLYTSWRRSRSTPYGWRGRSRQRSTIGYAPWAVGQGVYTASRCPTSPRRAVGVELQGSQQGQLPFINTPFSSRKQPIYTP